MPKIQPDAGAGSGRFGRGRRVANTMAEINVIPLVDVMLVLLIIFMVTAPMIQRGIDVSLPVATRTDQIQGERVFVTVPANYGESGLVYIGEEAVRREVFQERIRQRMETSTEKRVYLQGDGAVRLQELMDIIDRLKGAGVVQVGIVAKLPGEI